MDSFVSVKQQDGRYSISAASGEPMGTYASVKLVAQRYGVSTASVWR